MNPEVEEGLKRLNAAIAGSASAEDTARALPVSEVPLGRLLDTVPALMWAATTNGLHSYLNQGCVEYTGRSPGDFHRFGWVDLIHPEDRQETLKVWLDAVKSQSSYHVKHRIRRTDGEYRWFLSRGEPLRDHKGRMTQFVGFSMDIDDSVKREAELRRSQNYLAEAQKVSHTGSWAFNSVTREHIYWSEECFRIYGRDPALGPPSLKQVVADLHPEDASRMVANLKKAAREGRELDAEYRLVNCADGPRTLRAIAHPVLDCSGRVVEWIGTVMDISAMKRAEQELRKSELERERAEHALRDARERLAQASKIASLAELSASIAHEINQPLQAIVANGHAGLRWLDATPPDIGKAICSVERIVRDGNAAADVVNGIRALFKHATPAKVDLDINKLIAQIRCLIADEIRAGGVSLDSELGKDVPSIRADAVQIQQVIVNLVRNAVEAMAAATEEAKLLRIRTRCDGDEVVVDVQDRGPGLADPQKIFEPFVTTKETGMGMGLAICRSIVEAHAGRIWAAPNEDVGVTFSFSLPIEASDAK